MVAQRLDQTPWRAKRWLILAPHPDDETLGTGALIAEAAAELRLAAVVYLTDGSGSHSNADGCARKLVSTRRREAALSLFHLTGTRRHVPVRLDWRDARPETQDSMKFKRNVSQLAALCRRLRVDAIAVTAHHEPHCDHAAAAQLAYALSRSAKRDIQVAECCVWAAPLPKQTFRLVRTKPMLPGIRRRALGSHRSQLTPSYGEGFRLAVEEQRMAVRDTLFLRKRR